MYDVVIIGSGVSGTASARELAKYDLHICVLEKEEDVCCGTSKANSAIVHAGYDAKPGTLMAKMNVRGNFMMENLAQKLDIPFQRNGSLALCLDRHDFPKLQELYEQGLVNGVKGLQILDRESVLKMETNISEEVYAALYAPTTGIVCPFELNIALAENAHENGVEFRFNTKVEQVEKKKTGYILHTNKGIVETKVVVNAAGVYADEIHNMVSKKKIHIIPRRGDYLLLDKSEGKHVARTIFTLPNQYGKGVLVTPTIHGNLLIGPTAIDIEDKEGVNTTREGLEEVMHKAERSVKNLQIRQVITSFAGLRPHEEGHEFIIEEVEEGFIDCAGIESPGLASCPAIGERVASMIKEKFGAKEKETFIEERKGILNPNDLTIEQRNLLVREHPEYGTIICRCEMITEGEVIDAIRRPLGAKSLDGIKRRTRAGMGRCQSGFCSPKVMEILARELEIPISEVTKSGEGSEIITGKNKNSL